MSNYDAWLTTDRMRDAQEAYADWIVEQWEKFAEDHHLPVEACEEEHEAHGIYTAWEALLKMTEEYKSRLEEEQMLEAELAWEARTERLNR